MLSCGVLEEEGEVGVRGGEVGGGGVGGGIVCWGLGILLFCSILLLRNAWRTLSNMQLG